MNEPVKGIVDYKNWRKIARYPMTCPVVCPVEQNYRKKKNKIPIFFFNPNEHQIPHHKNIEKEYFILFFWVLRLSPSLINFAWFPVLHLLYFRTEYHHWINRSQKFNLFQISTNSNFEECFSLMARFRVPKNVHCWVREFVDKK